MSETESIIILIILFIILITSLIFLARGSTALRSVNNYSSDQNLAKGEDYILGGTVVGFLLVILIIFGLFYFGEEIYFYPGILTGIVILTLILTLTVGILSAAAASNIGASAIFNSDPNIAVSYNDCVICSSLTLGSLILAIILIVVYYSSERPYNPYYPPEPPY